LDGLFASSFDAFQKPSLLQTRRLQRHRAGLFERRPTEHLFFAALPDQATAARIADLAGRLKIGHGLKGRTPRPNHFHVALFHVGHRGGLAPDLIESLSRRAAGVVMPSFKVAFDKVGSFRNGAFVLRGNDGTFGLAVLHQRLSDTFDGRPASARPFTPHVTLLRDRERVEEHAIQPIEWTVREVVLMHSLQGRAEHRQLARFALN
jgi:2'-5' RNA ligase